MFLVKASIINMYCSIIYVQKSEKDYYLDSFGNLGMVYHTWRFSTIVLPFRIIKNPILPVATLCFSISECVHSQSLSSSFVPSTLISMTILKSINSKAVHHVGKIFSSIYVPISAIITLKQLSKLLPERNQTNPSGF